MYAVKKFYLLLTALMVAVGSSAIAVASPMDVTALTNKDVVLMVEQRLAAEAIVKAIKSSPCTFDTFPSVMKELKRRGVPDEVLEAMLAAPYGPAPVGISADEPEDDKIYHYMENIKQYLSPLNAGRRHGLPPARTRAARSTRIRRS
jgi:hypothetical protein